MKSQFLLILLYFFYFNCSKIQAQIIPSFVSKVYQDIYTVMDNGFVVKPTLVLSTNKDVVVNYFPTTNQIHIGTEFIKIARNFGKDSANVVAQVFGHELAHILLQQNDLIKNVGTGYASKEYNNTIKNIYKTLKDSVFERQADEYACFYAHIAGYNVINITPVLLDSIYTHFNLTDKQLKNYPKLSERKKIAQIAGKRMTVLNNLFDKAILATLTQKYPIAINLYQTILKEKFVSKEINNNLGLVYLLNAIQLRDSIQYPYTFPVQIETKTSLYNPNTRSLQGSPNDLLTEATRFFNLATLNNKNYATAWLNKAITEFLLQNYEDAEISISYANRSQDTTLKHKVNLLKAIIQFHQGEQNQALAKMEELSKVNAIALVNFNQLKTNALLVNQSLNKKLLTNNLSNLQKQFLNLPLVDFYSTEAKTSDSLKHILSHKPNISYKTIIQNDYIIEKIQVIHSDDPSYILFYTSPTIQLNINLKDVISFANQMYSGDNKDYIIVDNLILVFLNEVLDSWYWVN